MAGSADHHSLELPTGVTRIVAKMLGVRRIAPMAARAGSGVPGQAPVAPLGVPLDWCRGVALLATRDTPPTIPPQRWVVLAATSARLLRDNGAALHAGGWDALAVFGLDATAPTTNPPRWGLAWLLGDHGKVLDVQSDMVGMTREVGGAMLAYAVGSRRQAP